MNSVEVPALSVRLALAHLAIAEAELRDARMFVESLVRPDTCPEANPLNEDAS